MKYQLFIRHGQTIPDVVFQTKDDGSTASFLFDENNPDYQAYLAWVAEGGVPTPADNQIKE